MTFRLGLTLRQAQILHCPTCDAPRLRVDIEEASADIVLFGVTADPYGVCPTCRRAVGEVERRGETYRRRVRLVYFRHGIVLCQAASGRWRKERL